MSAAAAAAAAATAAVQLRNGVRLPLVGLGTYQVRGSACTASVLAALRAGVRLLDTAAVYRNEEDVAAGLEASGLPRGDVFITSKLAPRDAGPGAYAACLASLAALRTPYLDLYLVHWPGAQGVPLDDPRLPALRRESWQALERLLAEGRVRAIGVSNYTPRHLSEFDAPWVRELPHVNQVELHPRLPARDVVAACKARGIAVQAYSSLARGAPELLGAPALVAAAAAHGVAPAAVALRWAVQHGISVIPKSTHEERIAANAPGALDRFALTPPEMAALDALGDGEGLRTCWDPNTVG
jgi:diketogulonate reductase-like aldo/keto reductase